MISRRSRINDGMMLADLYLRVKAEVIDAGFASEIDWQDCVGRSPYTETDLLREAAWVILSSGMREAVIRRKFPGVSNAFLNWKSADAIVRSSAKCRQRALRVFRHRPKVAAIIAVARRIKDVGFACFSMDLLERGPSMLQELPYFGPATSLHLAKNLGLDVAKPDRHLVRMARSLHCEDAASLCERISAVIGDRVAVVDLVMWRFATITPGYVRDFEAHRYRATV